MRWQGKRARGGSGLIAIEYHAPPSQLSTTDFFNLERFVVAQAPVIAIVLEELRAGRKRSHWMWFVFPHQRAWNSKPDC
jgi:hypothetical protein